MFQSNKRTIANGFTMIELVFAIMILSTVLIAVLSSFSPSSKYAALSQEESRITYCLQDQAEHIKSIGFWVWSGDTASENINQQHPIWLWKTRLATLGYNGRAKMDVSFLKDSGSDLVLFTNNAKFDNDLPRNMVQVTLTLYTSKNQEMTETIFLSSVPTEKKCWAALNIIRQALLQYSEDNNGNYPTTYNWANALVGSYLDEIPNNPYTSQQSQITHLEEALDWYYENSGGTITLAANSHRNTIFTTL